MSNKKLQPILCLSLTLMVGFLSGFATRSLLPEIKAKTKQVPTITFNSQLPTDTNLWPGVRCFSDLTCPTSSFAGLNSIFDEVVKETLQPIGLSRSLHDASPLFLTSSPDFEYKKSNDHIYIVLSTAGLKPEDVNVSMAGTKLVVKAHHKEHAAHGMREETFIRTVDLPYGIDLSRIRKQSANGAVIVTVPRSVLSATELPI